MKVPDATAVAGATRAPGAPSDVVRVHVPARSLRSELRAIKIVWRRELIRFRNDRAAAEQPFVFACRFEDANLGRRQPFGVLHHHHSVSTGRERGSGHDFAALSSPYLDIRTGSRSRFAGNRKVCGNLRNVFESHSKSVPDRFVESR